MASEQQIQKQIIEYLHSVGVFCWRNFNGAMIVKGGRRVKSLANGSPDIMGVLPCGKSLQIEVKAHCKANRRKEQVQWIVKAQKNNALAFFAHDLETVRHYVEPCLSNCSVQRQILPLSFDLRNDKMKHG